MEYQKDDTISLGASVARCFIFLICSIVSLFLLLSIIPLQNPPTAGPDMDCFLAAFLEGGAAELPSQEIWLPYWGNRNEIHDPFVNHTTCNELNLSSKEKKTFIFFYCINNGKLDSFLYRLYIYRQVWLEKTSGKYGSQFSFIHWDNILIIYASLDQ